MEQNLRVVPLMIAHIVTGHMNLTIILVWRTIQMVQTLFHLIRQKNYSPKVKTYGANRCPRESK